MATGGRTRQDMAGEGSAGEGRGITGHKGMHVKAGRQIYGKSGHWEWSLFMRHISSTGRRTPSPGTQSHPCPGEGRRPGEGSCPLKEGETAGLAADEALCIWQTRTPLPFHEKPLRTLHHARQHAELLSQVDLSNSLGNKIESSGSQCNSSSSVFTVGTECSAAVYL